MMKDIATSQCRLLIGPGHSMEAKIENARALFGAVGPELLKEPGILSLLNQYREAVNESWQAMDEHGVVTECTDCAVNDGGSCCGKGIEEKFDSVLLLVNLLMETDIPSERQDPTGCWFLGEKGCLLLARHVICINYMCRRLYDRLSEHNIHSVQQAMGRETDLLFMLEQRIKSWLQVKGF